MPDIYMSPDDKIAATVWDDGTEGQTSIRAYLRRMLSKFLVGIRVMTTMEYYNSAEGGRRAFNATTDYITLPNTAATESFALFENPADSGVDVFLWLGEFASNQDVRFRRMSGAVIQTRATPRGTFNMGGGATAGKARLYTRSEFTVDAPTNHVTRKQAFMRAFQTYFTTLNMTRMKPGQHLYWTVDGRGEDVSIYLEWIELPAVA